MFGNIGLVVRQRAQLLVDILTPLLGKKAS